jgi:DNA-binding NtrC family response regulator
MRTTIVVLDADEGQRHHLCRLLSEQHCPSESLKTLDDLKQRIVKSDVLAVIIDIDSVAVDNRAIRELTNRNPDVYFFCLSKRRLHPELEDAIGSHLYACINKPVDPDELQFWISSVRKEGEGA